MTELYPNRQSTSTDLEFNILGRVYHVKRSLFEATSPTALARLERFYDRKRQQYVVNISPLIFERIVQYYTTQQLSMPSNVQLDYWRESIQLFEIDAPAVDIDRSYDRPVPRRASLRLLHVLLEYPDSCRLARAVHNICAIVALLSCSLASFTLIFRGRARDLHTWKVTETPAVFLADYLCLFWATGEIILRALSTPHLYDYVTTLGLFDITGVIFQFIYIGTAGSEMITSRCRGDHVRDTDQSTCIAFNRRLMIVNIFRKLRLVRYIRPLKHFVLALVTAKNEVLRVTALVCFIIAVLAPLVLIIESGHIDECASLTRAPATHCLRTLGDVYYYLVLIISTVGYGDIYPTSNLARLVAMFASPMAIMTLSAPLSSIYAGFTHQQELCRLQTSMPENVRYIVNDAVELIDEDEQQNNSPKDDDVTEEINEGLQRFGARRWDERHD